MKTITITVALTTMFASLNMTAQDQSTLPKVKEFGIGLTGFNSFSLQYRWGNEKRLFRVSGIIGGTFSSDNSSIEAISSTYPAASSTTKTTTPLDFNCSLNFSVLKLKSVSEKLGILYGGIVAFTYFEKKTNIVKISYNALDPTNTTTTTTKQNSKNFQPSLGFAIGAVYKINSSFLLYAEIDPNIYYSYAKGTSNSTTLNSNDFENGSGSKKIFGLANLSNSGASLTIVYRITN